MYTIQWERGSPSNTGVSLVCVEKKPKGYELIKETTLGINLARIASLPMY